MGPTRDISPISGTKTFNPFGFTKYMEFCSIKNQVGPHCVFTRCETDPELRVLVLVALKIEDWIASNWIKWATEYIMRRSEVDKWAFWSWLAVRCRRCTRIGSCQPEARSCSTPHDIPGLRGNLMMPVSSPWAEFSLSHHSRDFEGSGKVFYRERTNQTLYVTPCAKVGHRM